MRDARHAAILLHRKVCLVDDLAIPADNATVVADQHDLVAKVAEVVLEGIEGSSAGGGEERPHTRECVNALLETFGENGGVREEGPVHV